MPLIPYALGVLGAALVSILVVLFNQWAGFEIHSLSFWFIIPAGGLLLGIGGAGGFFIGKRYTHSKFAKIDYLIAIILGLSTFLSVNYISYQNTYLSIDETTPEDEIVKSQFSQPENYISMSEIVTFFDYLNLINSSSTQQMSRGVELELGETSTTILFYIQFLGVILGSIVLVLLFSDLKYCDNCKRYYSNKVLKSFNVEDFDKIAENLNKNLKDGSKIKNLIAEIKEKDTKADKFGNIEIDFCPKCHSGSIIIKFFTVGKKGDTDEVTDMRQEIMLNQTVIKDIIG